MFILKNGVLPPLRMSGYHQDAFNFFSGANKNLHLPLGSIREWSFPATEEIEKEP